MTAFPSINTPAGPVPADAPSWNRQTHSQMPSHRYRDVYSRVEVPLTERDWPSKRMTAAPLWVPVDLRDGNQALAEPMDPTRKRRLFELMVAMGYKEIEVGYPSASQTDYDFIRLIADTDIAPGDVTIVVFTPARRDLIERTVESIRGVRNDVVVHMYTATAPTWRDVVLGHGRTALTELIVSGGRDVLEFAGDLENVRFEFSPEVFNLTEPDYALEVCDDMTTLWDASAQRPVIVNLPATVEIATPNVYADQIEYMHKNLTRRDAVILSVHPHNDRGTGVACAELAVLAGAQRVEGCIFGNGERTGNVDIATLALNLHAQGVDPMIDFSDIDEIRRTVEHANRIEINPRHPYVGDLVHTAFSGTHQDAIKKGFAEHHARAAAEGRRVSETEWRVPYLPIDPADLGRSYDAVIRVNSQSGKGGIAYLLETEYGIELPRRLQIDFARHVQKHTDATGSEVTASQLWDIFEAEYIVTPGGKPAIELTGFDTTEETTTLTLRVDNSEHSSSHHGVGPVEAVTEALARVGISLDVLALHQTSIGSGSGAPAPSALEDSDALTLIEYRRGTVTRWAAGKSRSVLTATLESLIGAANTGPSAALTGDQTSVVTDCVSTDLAHR
ncbi:2-isopropylmalate synthase [Rhodococcus sp. HNM0563]|uniref:2-isopropylmalate synthase n=1 Tax=unclassified Rhodococcus (in: high G+C Gram-positive bacteria) TaxID=192944 RepID=UPI00146BD89C|nr:MULTISPECIES: 2-isopropylmalate synthase [unclassified Rhodococcus (in: high G+C Gram-positive bacteria)]MCK0091643.1 2-isopropylmalate synthase [Rhodococcus sp. F64268]NLU63965.1 2-isopropylmalate synthase [Rhodococcus sp. HNM0563]